LDADKLRRWGDGMRGEKVNGGNSRIVGFLYPLVLQATATRACRHIVSRPFDPAAIALVQDIGIDNVAAWAA
jgi:hypothetical protein